MLEYRESCGHIKEGWCLYCIDLWKEAYEKGKRDALINKKKGYMCGTDYEYELENASGGVKIYSSVEDLKKHKTCWEDCGIIEIELVVKNDKTSDSDAV